MATTFHWQQIPRLIALRRLPATPYIYDFRGSYLDKPPLQYGPFCLHFSLSKFFSLLLSALSTLPSERSRNWDGVKIFWDGVWEHYICILLSDFCDSYSILGVSTRLSLFRC